MQTKKNGFSIDNVGCIYLKDSFVDFRWVYTQAKQTRVAVKNKALESKQKASWQNPKKK